MQKARDIDNLERWVLYILDGIEETSKHTLEKIRKIKDLLDLTIIEVKEKCPKIYSKELVEVIFENPYSKIDYLVTKLGINRKTASKYLMELEDKNFLSHIKAGKEKLYINGNLMDLLKTHESAGL